MLRHVLVSAVSFIACALSSEAIMAAGNFERSEPTDVVDSSEIPSKPCKAEASKTSTADLQGFEWNGWGREPRNSRYQPFSALNAENVTRLKPKWVFGYPMKRAVGQPTVANGRILVINGTKVFALSAASGCTLWEYDSQTLVRTTVVIGSTADGRAQLAYVGDQNAFIHAIDVATGAGMWKVKVEEFPAAVITGTPTFYKGRLYVPVSSSEEALAGYDASYECCKFRGSVTALDASNGKVAWKTYTIPVEPHRTKPNEAGTMMFGPAGAAIWSSPTIDVQKQLLYVATGNSYTEVDENTSDAILAMDLTTGKVKWSRQLTEKDNFVMSCKIPGRNNCPTTLGEDFDFGSSPILHSRKGGGRTLLVGQKSGVVHALDPDRKGAIQWQVRLSTGGSLGGIQWGPAADSKSIYVAISDAATIPSAAAPALHAIDVDTGKVRWSVPAPKPDCSWGVVGCSHAQSQAVTAVADVVFSGSLDGHLRAYSSASGKILWDFDTAQSFQSVNGIPANGGSLDNGGPVIVGDTLYINSGYVLAAGHAGNALIAFSIDGRQ